MFFDKSLFSKIMRKINENPLQNLAKTIPKPAKIHPESQKIHTESAKIHPESLRIYPGSVSL